VNDDSKDNQEKKQKKPYCKQCKTKGHITKECDKWDEEPCTHCGQFNHESKDCWHKDKPKQDKGKGNANLCKRPGNEETNIADSDSQHSVVTIEEPGDVAPGRIVFDASEHRQYFNFNSHNVTNFNGIDKCTIWYDWLADSATTSHIVNCHDVFKTFETIKNTPITGVGGLQTHTEGHGDVNIYTKLNGETHFIHLCNILYVPSNRNNLFSLRHWLAKGSDFCGHDLTLISKTGNPITKGILTSNNLIKLRFRYAKDATHISNTPHTNTSCPAVEKPKSWNMWHRCFTHISISGLCKLFKKQLVTGFNVDCESAFSDCTACTEAKQSVIPFSKMADHNTEPGELTHIDVWGKYPVSSINGFQYYLLMVDDTLCYVTVEFLKSKDQATQKLKNYFTHLEV
jgi:hypothetical protein